MKGVPISQKRRRQRRRSWFHTKIVLWVPGNGSGPGGGVLWEREGSKGAKQIPLPSLDGGSSGTGKGRLLLWGRSQVMLPNHSFSEHLAQTQARTLEKSMTVFVRSIWGTKRELDLSAGI